MTAAMNVTCSFIADLTDVSSIVKEITDTAVALNIDPDAIGDMAVALHEAVSNSIKHGYQRQPGYIEIEMSRRGDDLVVSLRDKAPLFDPMTVPAPDISLPLNQRAQGGMGIHMIRNFTDEFRYQITDTNQNEVILVKRNAFSDQGA